MLKLEKGNKSGRGTPDNASFFCWCFVISQIRGENGGQRVKAFSVVHVRDAVVPVENTRYGFFGENRLYVYCKYRHSMFIHGTR